MRTTHLSAYAPGGDAHVLHSYGLFLQLTVSLCVCACMCVRVRVKHRYLEPSTAIGVIIGTGTNACYVERLSSLTKWQPQGVTLPPDTQTAVNIEWGAFDSPSLPRCAEDKDVDEATPHKGESTHMGTHTHTHVSLLVFGSPLTQCDAACWQLASRAVFACRAVLICVCVRVYVCVCVCVCLIQVVTFLKRC